MLPLQRLRQEKFRGHQIGFGEKSVDKKRRVTPKNQILKDIGAKSNKSMDPY